MEDTPHSPTERLLTVQEAAEYLRVSESMLAKLVKAHAVASVKIGSRRLFRPAALAEYVAALEQPATSRPNPYGRLRRGTAA